MFSSEVLSAIRLVICGSVLPTASYGQEALDSLRGSVRDDAARPVVGAAVYVTRGSDRAVLQATTGAAGEWTIRFENGTGDYLVFVSAPGMQSARRRVQRTGTEREFVVDFSLLRVGAQQLSTVRVEGRGGRRPDNGIRLGVEEVGASDRWVDGVTASLPPTARGDIPSMLGTVPGLVFSSDGASLAGAAASSNLVTLNGAALPAGALPRGAPVDARFSAGTMDATRGGFAGGQFDLRLASGNRDLHRRRAWGTFGPSAFQGTDAIGRSVGADASAVRLSASAEGEAVRRALNYNVSVDVARTRSEPAALSTASARALSAAGLSADSAQRLTATALSLGMPGDVMLSAGTEAWSVLARFDDTRDTTRVLALTTFVSDASRTGLGASPRRAASSTANQRDRAMSAQLLYQRTGVQRSWFNENRLAVSRTSAEGEPRLHLPSAAVTTDATTDAFSLLGGAPSASIGRKGTTVEAASEWAWLGKTPAHRFRAIAWGRRDGLSDQSVENPFGTWYFTSISAFANQQPAQFVRTLEQASRAGSAWNGTLAISHQWRARPTLQLLWGARLEGNAFGTPVGGSIALGDVSASSTLRTNYAPARVHLSPRMGLTWQLGGGDARSAQMYAPYGTVVRPSMGVLRAGFGEFRDLYSAQTVASLRTGEGASARMLSCTGPTAPIPDWRALGSSSVAIPDQCVGANPLLAQRARTLRFLSSSYDASRTWRGYVNYSRNVGSWLARIEALGAVNLALPSIIDRNFTNTRLDSTADEGRALYVPASAVDPRSGAVAVTASRRDPAYGAAHELRSDLRSEAGQVSLGVTSDMFKWRSQYYAATWTVQTVRQQYRGADGSNGGDPNRIEWARGLTDARHSLLLQYGYTLPAQRGTFTLFARLQSGLPFTPLVRGDVDGDGVSGDRAFIFDPARDTDPQRAALMRNLLATSAPSVRRCLATQKGTIAGRNSCTGPWTITTTARVDLPVLAKVGGRYLRAAVNVENLAAGVDLLLHGDDPRGWGSPEMPDPVLLASRGFDAGARQFSYAVNPRFGSTRPSQSLLRSPFRVVLDFSLDLTKALAEQRLARTLEPVRRNGRWEQPTVTDMEQVQMRQVSSLHRLLLTFSDTLFLTREQIDRLRQADSVYQDEARALFAPLAARFANRSSRETPTAMLADIRATELAYQRRFWAQRDIVQSILTPLQASVMPEIAKMIMLQQLAPDTQRWPRWFFADDGSVAGVGPPP